jgi:hypothetical protein
MGNIHKRRIYEAKKSIVIQDVIYRFKIKYQLGDEKDQYGFPVFLPEIFLTPEF